MKRAYDSFIDFSVITDYDTYNMLFSNEYRFTEMFDFMVDHFAINPDTIVEVRSCYTKRYKLFKDA